MSFCTRPPLRIAMISYYLPSGSRIGVGHQVHALANAMVALGHEVTVFSGCGPSGGARYQTETVPLSGANRTFKFAWRLRHLDWSGYDVIHAHGDDNWLPLRHQPPRVRTLHGSCLSEARFVNGRRECLRMLLLGLGELVSTVTADTVIGVSRNTYRWLPWVRQVIPNGIDLDRFTPGERSEAPSILFVGTYEWRKRGKLLADLFESEIEPRVPGAELWMVAPDAPSRGRIRLYGRVSDEELAELYGRAWVFCLPSTYEGFGIPYVEAMASGAAVVASPNPGAVEVTDGGRLGVIAGDDTLAEALVSMLTSDQLRQGFVDRARAIVDRYSLTAIAQEYECVYRRVLAR